MRDDRREHHDCPPDVADGLLRAGGTNLFGEPNYRVVWGFDRIVKITGRWEEIKPAEYVYAQKQGKVHRIMVSPPLVGHSAVETREVPKYLPGNCWHLEKWCPPSDYGTPEEWRARGQEIEGGQTIDAAGEYPSRGDYEQVMCLTDSGTPSGNPIPLDAEYVALIVELIEKSRGIPMSMRLLAIKTREEQKELLHTELMKDLLREGRKAFGTRPRSWVPDRITEVV